MADSNLVDFRSNTTFGRIYSFADDFQNRAGVNNLDEQLLLDRQRFADHASGRSLLPPKESLALRDRIEKTTELLNPGAQNVWGPLSEAELAWQDEVKAASRKFANIIGMLAGGPALTVLPASGRMLGASEDIIEKLAQVNAGAASVLGIPKPTSLPWVHPINGRLVHRSADLSQPPYGRRVGDTGSGSVAKTHPLVASSRDVGGLSSQRRVVNGASAHERTAPKQLDMKGGESGSRIYDQSEESALRPDVPNAKRKISKKRKNVAKKGTFVAKVLPKPTVTAEAHVAGQVFRGTNQKARQNRDPNHAIAAVEKVKSAPGYLPGNPNTSMYNAHAEIEAMQLAFEAGVTQDADMLIKLTGKDLCTYCRTNVVDMAETIGLRSLEVKGPNGEYFSWKRN